MQGSISVQTIRSYLGLATLQGLDFEATVEATGARTLLEDVDGRVPWPVCERIGAEIVRRIGVGGAVRAMGQLGDGGVGVLYYMARHSATVGLALRRVVQYYGVTSSLAESEIIETAPLGRLELRQRPYVKDPIRSLISVLWSVSNVVTLRQMLGRDFRPVSVGLEMPRPAEADLAVFESVLRCPLEFDRPVSTVVFEAAIMAEAVHGADPVLEAALVNYVAELSDRVEPSGDTIATRLKQYIVEAMGTGDVTLRQAARHLGTTGRTLQRHLHAAGTSFQAVLDEVRRDVALVQMRTRRQSIDELALVLGFDKASSFHRAFKRWTGRTPGEFRRQG